MKATRKQIALIHIAKKQLGLTEDAYRSILWHIGGVESSKELDQIGFECVMQYLAALGFKSDWTRKFYGHRPGMPTPAQVSLIRALWREYTDGEGDDLSLGQWLDRFFHVTALRFVSQEQAHKAITALKQMKARKGKKLQPA